MAAAQVVRQPIRRVVSFGSLTVGGCLTPELPQFPVAESHGASDCTALSQPGAPPHPWAVWGVSAGKHRAASQELLLPVCVPAVGTRGSTGDQAVLVFVPAVWQEPTGTNAAPASAVERRGGGASLRQFLR